MFNALPQKLASPFGLLGDNAKLTFRTSPGGIRRLAETKLISATDSYWDQYTTLFDSPSDVFSLISSNDIRRALIDSPANVATLITVLCTRLFNLVSDHTFPTASSSSSQFVPSFANSILKASSGMASRDTTKEVLNCLRVLQRVLPVVFEAEYAEFEQAILWKKEVVPERGEVVDEQTQPQFVIEDDEGDDESERPGSRTAQNAGHAENKPKTLPSLAERLISCTIDLLFCCGFTLPSNLQVDHYKINYVIWEKGVGSTLDPGTNHAHDSHKVEVLRLLLVLFSKQIYVAPTSLLTTPSSYSLYFVQSTPRRHVLAILCSLLNTAMNSVTSPSGTVAAALPYNHWVFKGEDMKSTLVGHCLEVLCALLDFQSGSARDITAAGGDAGSVAPLMKTNAFRYFAAKLHRAADFSFILDGVVGRLAQFTAHLSIVLPGSSKPVPHIPETVLFFWKMMDLNKKFRTYVIDSDKVVDLVVHLLCYCLDAKDKPEQHGLCRAISYILQTLSAERQFCEKMLKPFTIPVPSKLSSQGTIVDFMVASIYAIVATSSGSLSSLHPTLVIVLSNMAPHMKHLSVVSSSKLLSLSMSFSNPAFLLADEGHPRLLFFLLEAFNSIIYAHPRDNPNLLYAIVRSHKTFEDLNSFSLARGLRQIKQMQLAKEEEENRRGGRDNSKRSSLDRTQSQDQEKTRLLAQEGRSSLNGDETLYAASLNEAEQALTTTQPLVSPTSTTAPTPHRSPTPSSGGAEHELVGDDAAGSQPLSEKARGKRREQTHAMTSSLEHVAATGVGRNGFVPTEDWVESWHQGLPLDPILLMIAELLPRIREMQTNVPKSKLTGTIIDYLRAVDLGRILPPQAETHPRTFKWTDASLVWMTSLIWGEIFVRGTSPLGLWNATNVRLFYIKHAQAQNRQISEAVSTMVGGLGGLLGRGGENQTARSRSAR